MSASEQKLPSQRWEDKKDALWARPYTSKTPIFENRIYEKREMKLGLKGILAAGNNSREVLPHSQLTEAAARVV